MHCPKKAFATGVQTSFSSPSPSPRGRAHPASFHRAIKGSFAMPATRGRRRFFQHASKLSLRASSSRALLAGALHCDLELAGRSAFLCAAWCAAWCAAAAQSRQRRPASLMRTRREMVMGCSGTEEAGASRSMGKHRRLAAGETGWPDPAAAPLAATQPTAPARALEAAAPARGRGVRPEQSPHLLPPAQPAVGPGQRRPRGRPSPGALGSEL